MFLEEETEEENWPYEVDVTDSIEVYPKGKTWDCPCGAGIGTGFQVHKIKCYKCKDYILVDDEHLDRENQKKNEPIDESQQDGDEGQGLERWM